MTRRKRRNHSPEFKAKVALAAAKGDKTLAELASKFDIHANQITQWKQELTDNAAILFGKTSLNEEKNQRNQGEEISKLHAKIGQLTMENDFLSKVLDR